MYYSVFSEYYTALGLKGIKRDVFAIIRGFSQNNEAGGFNGSLGYLVNTTGYSKSRISDTLRDLTNKGLLDKEEVFKNSVKFCKYTVSDEAFQKMDGYCQKSNGGVAKKATGVLLKKQRGIAKKATNNIVDIIEDNIIKEIEEEKPVSFEDLLEKKLTDDEIFDKNISQKDREEMLLVLELFLDLPMYSMAKPQLRELIREFIGSRKGAERGLTSRAFKSQLIGIKRLEVSVTDLASWIRRSISSGYQCMYYKNNKSSYVKPVEEKSDFDITKAFSGNKIKTLE